MIIIMKTDYIIKVLDSLRRNDLPGAKTGLRGKGVHTDKKVKISSRVERQNFTFMILCKESIFFPVKGYILHASPLNDWVNQPKLITNHPIKVEIYFLERNWLQKVKF